MPRLGSSLLLAAAALVVSVAAMRAASERPITILGISLERPDLVRVAYIPRLHAGGPRTPIASLRIGESLQQYHLLSIDHPRPSVTRVTFRDHRTRKLLRYICTGASDFQLEK